MAARIVEFFGFKPLDPAGFPLADAEPPQCPFINKSKCIKPTLGACSIEQSTGAPIIICPNRLYANDHAILGDVAIQAFGPGVFLTKAADIKAHKLVGTLTGNEVAVFGRYWGSELKIPQPKASDEDVTGGFSIDYVLARLNMAGDMVDFTAVEIQSIDTTNSYSEQSKAFFAHTPFIDTKGNNPGWSSAGLNWANVSKRILPQLIYKGSVLRRERFCTKGLFFVVPTAVLNKIIARLGGWPLEYPIAAGTITFQAYDLGSDAGLGNHRPLLKGKTYTTTVEQVGYAFVSPVNLPQMGVYETAIKVALQK
jgi:hypothetical protein